MLSEHDQELKLRQQHEVLSQTVNIEQLWPKLKCYVERKRRLKGMLLVDVPC